LTSPREGTQPRTLRDRLEPHFRLATIILYLMALISFFSAPAASFLAVIAGLTGVVATTGMSKAVLITAITQSGTGLASLYFLGEFLLTYSAEYLALGAVILVVSLLVLYVEVKVFILRRKLGKVDLLVMSVTAVALALTFYEALNSLGGFLEGFTWSPQELATLSGLLYMSATLPLSALIPFVLTYLVYSILRSMHAKESPQATDKITDLSEDSIVLNA